MTGFFFETRFAAIENARPSLRSSMHRDRLRRIVLLEERQSCSAMSDLLPSPTIAETPILQTG
jgi:hypothetical protein